MGDKIIDLSLVRKENESSLEKKIEKIQANGQKEILLYKKITSEFLDSLRDLAIIEPLMNDFLGYQLEDYFQNILNAVIKPIFQGDPSPFMSEEDYLRFRTDMYESLAKKYDLIGEPPF